MLGSCIWGSLVPVTTFRGPLPGRLQSPASSLQATPSPLIAGCSSSSHLRCTAPRVQILGPCLQVLGLPRNADSESIQRVYNKKKRENRDNQEVLDRIEKAHSTLMMRQFTMRVQARAT